ncbi:NfeD family protein [Lederbergia wuyishanensis]|uniref:Membrane protein implicated in regulation of membrane protease activity n=1 Tax=Lederbergia wuyishanensis TaxID=1347903 RepID=A0ABU0D7N8_9BACI|nr:NfeD family protein [Lederbergia wuyishanensis]MCJ8009048.1 NfeD family protein [Lederbergia wuyishanensis]MDQ0344383.1 membrane protein implicated in regulation of membrane protease activity [Lederbergia wuyishanensis]
MTLFGMSIETIYLILLIISGSLTILYLFFGDVLEGMGEATDFLNPVLILAFITFFSAGGYILEKATALNSFLIIAIAAVISALLDVLLNVFVLVPMKSAEQSLSYTEKSLEGRVGKAIISIPKEGFGEVVIESYSGMISKPAASFEDVPIPEGSEVLVIEVKNGVLYVMPYKPNFK